MEILSLVAWITVVVVQFLVHFVLRYRRRIKEDENNLRDLPLLVGSDEDFSRTDHSAILSSEEEDTKSLDGDEPEVFFKLLKQNGMEMVSVSVSKTLTYYCLFSRKDFASPFDRLCFSGTFAQGHRARY